MTKTEFKKELAQKVFDCRVYGSIFSDMEILRHLYNFGFAKVEGIKAVEWINKKVAEALSGGIKRRH